MDQEVRVPGACFQLVRLEWRGEPQVGLISGASLCLDLSLSSRPVGFAGHLPDIWPGYRSEPLGDCFLHPPNQPLTLSFPAYHGQPLLSCLCYLDLAVFEQWCATAITWDERPRQAALNLADRSIKQIMLKATRELMAAQHASQALLSALVVELAIELGRLFNNEALLPLKGGLAGWRLSAIDKRIHQPGKAPTLGELAALCKISVRQLSRGFATSRGMPVAKYIDQQRIELAKRAIAEGAAVADVSSHLGFASASSFSHSFRRLVGVSPTRFRTIVSRL